MIAQNTRIIDQLGAPTLVVIAANIAVSLWVWLAFVLTAPRDFASFILTLMVTTMIASVVQLSILTLSPALRA
ncbi:MAG: hypothetical protein M3N46_07840, partial [Actinomycetota bacterium]|nr:hypothetical protein [Actinomycetota bacterium]